MLSTKSINSIRGKLALKLVPAFAVLVFLFSYIVYGLISKTLYDDVENEMVQVVSDGGPLASVLITDNLTIEEKVASSILETTANITLSTQKRYCNDYSTVIINNQTNSQFIINYPYNLEKKECIKISRDVTNVAKLLEKIRNIIIFLNLLAIVFIGLFSYIYSEILAGPIRKLSNELANMDEHSLKLLGKEDDEKLPLEFRPLERTINILIRRVRGHISYQKELFIGLAHELKTPLAVIKARNSVTLLKDRDVEKYKEVLKLNNKVIDEMNSMTSSILDMGRAEYAQLEPQGEINLTEFLNQKSSDYQLLAKNKKQNFISNIFKEQVICILQPTLLNQILQNFIQNAFKFTPEGKNIYMECKIDKKNTHILIEVIDEGCGVAEGIDPFAPFIRKGKEQGVGLGLFLAQNAASALNSKICIRNRSEASGAIAGLRLDYYKIIKEVK